MRPTIQMEHADTKTKLRVFLLLWKRWVGKRNTAFLNFLRLQELARTYPVEFAWAVSPLTTVVGDLTSGMEALGFRHPISRRLVSSQAFRTLRRVVYVSQSELARARAGVLHTLEYFPVNRLHIPIMLEYDFFAFGQPQYHDEIRRLLYLPEWMIARSTLVSVRHELSLEAFRALYPRYADRGVVIPHYLPSLEAAAENTVHRKFAEFGQPHVRVLFVGNQARVKGLPELVEAYAQVRARVGPRIMLTVVSRFQDGPVALPSEVAVHSNLPVAAVYELMAGAHVFAMPTKREATGNVFWEAMANGCAILAPAVEPQRTLFGRFGIAADPRRVDDLAQALERLVTDAVFARERALRARATFLARYHYTAVGQRQFEAFQRAVAEGPRS